MPIPRHRILGLLLWALLPLGMALWAAAQWRPLTAEMRQAIAALPASRAAMVRGTACLNTTPADSLLRLPGIGPATARQIVQWRVRHRGFADTAQLCLLGAVGSRCGQLQPLFVQPPRPWRPRPDDSVFLALAYDSLARRKYGPGYTPMEAKPDARRQPLNLNLADSAALEALPGLGPVLAGRVVRFRASLGGYHSVAQLKDVYGLRPEHYDKASPWLHVLPGGVSTIDPATPDGRQALLAHPYTRRFKLKQCLKSMDGPALPPCVPDSVRWRLGPYLKE